MAAMSSPYGKASVIIGLTPSGNPEMPADEVDRLLEPTGIEYTLHSAELPGDCSRLAREAVENGSGYLIWVGDDWTLHEVVNGLMGPAGPINPELVVAGVPGTSGSDFLKTVGMNNLPKDAVRHLATEPYFGVDVGRVTWAPPAEPGYSYFINVAQAGMAGDMARRRRRLPRRLGRIGDLLAFWASLLCFKVPTGAVKADRRSFGGPVVNVVVANGQFVRGGVRLAMKAHPGDGKFDVLIQKGAKRDFVETMTLTLKGEHLPSPKIKEYLAGRVEVAARGPLPIELDGRPMGYAPAIFEVVPQAFRLKI